MSGIPLANFPALRKYKKLLEAEGHIVISPVEHNEMMGLTEEVANERYDKKAAILWDLEQVTDSEVVWMLEGWENSPGCLTEIALAKFMNIPVFAIYYTTRELEYFRV